VLKEHKEIPVERLCELNLSISSKKLCSFAMRLCWSYGVSISFGESVVALLWNFRWNVKLSLNKFHQNLNVYLLYLYRWKIS